MKIKSINIKSFKSILDAHIEINHSCLGLVGTNEAGKSNFLDALSKINPANSLKSSDKSKDATEPPYLQFEIVLNEQEKQLLSDQTNNYFNENSTNLKPLYDDKIIITQHIKFESKEERWYSIKGVNSPIGSYFLKDEFIRNNYIVPFANKKTLYHNFLIIDKKTLEQEANNLILNKNLKTTLEEIDTLLSKQSNNEQDTLKIGIKIDKLNKKSEDILSKISYNILDEIALLNSNLTGKIEEHKQLQLKIDNQNTELNNLTQLESKSETQESQLLQLKKNIEIENKKLKSTTKTIQELEEEKESLFKPLENQYTQDISIFQKDLVNNINDTLENLIPKVIYWENDPKFILPSSIRINDLLKLSNEEDVPRPLINMFRIAGNINSLEEFKLLLQELVKNGSKRSSISSKLNDKVNKHIKGIWQEYDQELKITVEENEIRIEVFDPQRNSDAEFFELEERSQGCKAFLSFILTIGAESKTNIIKDNLLLLDEPENHLHPSGQRFMLKELLNISKNNQVFYATHSNHMIIKNNYDQHLIVKKEKDQTEITPSQKNRIGYFMQEEVLYDAVGVDLSSDVSSIEDYNFVFEGKGDVVLFYHLYNEILKDTERPFDVKKTKFYQGGKCSDIIKCFKKRPIQLGTKWVFILDADKPADILSKFISKKYGSYINKDIFIYQYPKAGKAEKEGELEDLISPEVMHKAYKKAFEKFDIGFKEDDILNIIKKDEGYSVYSKKIKTKYNIKDDHPFNSKFKEIFNSILEEEIVTASDKTKFKKYFSKYLEFGERLSSEIKVKLKQSI